MPSPILFIIMISDLPESSNGVKLAVFTNFRSMWKSGPSLSALSTDIQRYPAETAKFFEEWGFKISINKAAEILFSRSKHIPTYEIIMKFNDDTIKFFEKTVKFIGVISDQSLTWAADIDSIIDRCKVRLNLMRATTESIWGASRSILLIIYKDLVRSVINSE